MKRYGIRTTIASLLCVAAAWIGCAPEQQVVTPAYWISPDTVRQGGFAVIGVTVVEEVEQIRPPLLAELERALRIYRHDLAFRPAASVRDTLGPTLYRRLLFTYQEGGKLPPEDLATLSQRLGPGSRFALLVRVEKNSVHVSGGAPIQQSGAMGGAIPTPISVRRDARLRATLYDLAERMTAWEAVYASSSENAPPDTLVRPPKQVSFNAPGADMDVREGGGDPGPHSPSLAEALAEGFRAMVDDLPGGATAVPPATPQPAATKKR